MDPRCHMPDGKVDRRPFPNHAGRKRGEPMTVSALETRPLPPQRREDRGLPWIGHLLAYQRDPIGLYRRHWEHYGPVAPSRMLGKDTVMLLGPDACGEAL